MPEGELPTDALSDEPAATSVEEQAPEQVGAVDEGSAQEGTVPAARFNGLMSRLNQEIAARKSLEAELVSLRSQPQEKPVTVSDDPSVQATINALREELLEEKIERAREKALKDFPEISAFADLIVGNNPREVREVAQDLSNRLKQAGFVSAPATTTTETQETTEVPAPATVQAAQEAPVPEPPVAGGATTVVGDVSADERVTDAKKRRSFKDYLDAKWEATQAGRNQGGLALEKSAS